MCTNVQVSYPWRALRRLHFPTSLLIVKWDHRTSWPLNREQKRCMSLLAWVKWKALWILSTQSLWEQTWRPYVESGAKRCQEPGSLSHCMEKSHHNESPDLSRLWGRNKLSQLSHWDLGLVSHGSISSAYSNTTHLDPVYSCCQHVYIISRYDVQRKYKNCSLVLSGQ